MHFYKLKVERVVDGDTIEGVFDIEDFDILVKGKIRLIATNTPESRTSYELEDNAGELVKKWLKDMIEGKTIYVSSHNLEKGKYGRYLGEIYLHKEDKKSINQLLIEKKFAREYFGGKRKKWSEEELNYIINELQEVVE